MQSQSQKAKGSNLFDFFFVCILYGAKLRFFATKKTKNAQNRSRHKAEEATLKVHPLLTGYVLGRNRQNLNSLREKWGEQLLTIRVEEGECEIIAKVNNCVLPPVLCTPDPFTYS